MISLSPIHRDARVLRQLSVVAEFGHVTTIGYGPKPEGSDEHLQVPDGLSTLPQTPLGIAKLALRRLRAAELEAPASQWVLKAVKGRRFDIVVANEARILALADAVAGGAPIWADMHEWAPEERTHILSWRLLVAPLMDHLCRTYLPRCAAITTVGDRIGELYRSRYGVEARTMRNSSPIGTFPSARSRTMPCASSTPVRRSRAGTSNSPSTWSARCPNASAWTSTWSRPTMAAGICAASPSAHRPMDGSASWILCPR